MVIIDAPSELATELFGNRSQAVVNDIKSRLDAFVAATGNNNHARKAVERFRSVTSGRIFRKIQAIRNKYSRVRVSNNDHFIRPSTVSDVQTAPDVMLPYILACPEVKELHQEGMIDGYEKRYQSGYINSNLTADPHYRAATDGMIEVDDKDTLKVSCYINDEKHRKLTNFDKNCVRSAWNISRSAIEEGIDPTSVDNNTIA